MNTFNRLRAVVGILIFIGAITMVMVSTETIQARALPDNISTLAEQISPAVVNIRTVKLSKGAGRVFRQFRTPFGPNDPFNDFFEKFFGDDRQREFKQRSLGSGFIIDPDGYIVTNNHVIEDADQIQVKLNNGKEYNAEVVGRDPNTDIALIKLKDAEGKLPSVVLGDSEKLKVGEWVVAIGSPFGLEHTVTVGIVSAKGRVIGSGPYDDFIQTDASINPGNSGGPLINMDGEVIGINTAIIATAQGIGFAVPINLAKGIISQLKKSGEVTRGWLGVAIQDLTDEIAEYYGVENKKGVLVTDVFKGDPADKAGIQIKDIIIEVDGKKIETSRELTRIIADIGVGEKATIKVLRKGKEKTFTVTIAKRDDQRISSKMDTKQQNYELGIEVAQLNPEIARRFNVNETEGVIVTNVDPDSNAYREGIQVSDIIKEINHEPIYTVDDYNREINKVEKGGVIQMFIKRMNSGFIVVKLKK